MPSQVMMTQAYFDNLKYYVLQELRNSHRSVLLSVPRLEEPEIWDMLCDKAHAGVSVELFIGEPADTGSRPEQQRERLARSGVKVYAPPQAAAHTPTPQESAHREQQPPYCVLDAETVILGSYNWGHAQDTGLENLTITRQNPNLASQFVRQFTDRARKYAALPASRMPDTARLQKRVEMLQTAIQLQEPQEISEQADKLRKMLPPEVNHPGKTEIETALQRLAVGAYAEVLELLNRGLQQLQQLTPLGDAEIQELELQVRALEVQIGALEDEKTEMQKLLYRFSVRHNQELGDLNVRILELREARRRERAEKARRLAEIDPSEARTREYHQAKQAYEQARKESASYRQGYEQTRVFELRELTEDKQKELRMLFRKASKRCHPDVVVPEYREWAEQVFKELTQAYEQNDLPTVLRIYEQLKDEASWGQAFTQDRACHRLQSERARLRQSLERLTREIEQIRDSETYRLVCAIEDWDTYFRVKKEQLSEVLKSLQNETLQHDHGF